MNRIKIVLVSLIVLLLAGATLVPAAAHGTPPPAQTCTGNIVEVAICVNTSGATAGQFDTLIAAVVTAELADDLQTPGPFTVFAPTDAAFARLGITPENVASLDRAFLTNVLLYHVSAGERFAASFRHPTSLRMLNGQRTFVFTANRTVRVLHSRGLARVIVGNVDATNGVIHVVNQVLVPPTRH
jgi:uncharacterized surface protein with fasciclin (FAS1) repeats